MFLKDIEVGQNCIVENIDLSPNMKRHLEALGMTDRAPVLVLNKKGSGIMIIRMRGSRFALGSNITHKITVRVKDE